jgi:hypothetical protein
MSLSEPALVLSRRAVRWCDGAAAAAIAVFTGLGVAAGVQLSAIAGLHLTMLDAARALEVTAHAVGLIGEVPIVGDDTGRLAGTVEATAAQVRAGAAVVDERLRTLGQLVGVVIAAIPVVPLVLLYAPLRFARLRELRALRQLLSGQPDPALVEYLAHAAVRHLSYGQLREISPCPWLDLTRGCHAPLAVAELNRLGIRPPGWLTAAGVPHG